MASLTSDAHTAGCLCPDMQRSVRTVAPPPSSFCRPMPLDDVGRSSGPSEINQGSSLTSIWPHRAGWSHGDAARRWMQTFPNGPAGVSRARHGEPG